MKRFCAGYTIVEVLIAAAILMIAVGAAAALSAASSTQEDTNTRISRCLNLQEQAVRLYQLGISPDSISDILPSDPDTNSLTFTTNSLVIDNLGTVDEASVQLVFTTSPSSARFTNTMTAIRPSIR
ncbi:MAG: prepilin-type N-terminal cleavage/methylation domain-containing protein [Chthoniobacterales bacterium]